MPILACLTLVEGAIHDINLTEQRLFSAVLSYPATGLSD
jgi:hypothetical protein